jgi:hypothetical protein
MIERLRCPLRCCLPGLVLAVFLFALPPALGAQEPAPADELSGHLATRKSQAEDPGLSIDEREAIIQELAELLNRAAMGSKTVEQREARWGQAMALLDEFRDKNVGHPRAREFQLQAAVYRWAQGQGWQEILDLNPSSSRAREHAVWALDDAIARLRAIKATEQENALVENIRFRLARALADRADLDPADSTTRRSLQADALSVLGEPISEPGLRGFADLLKGDLLRRSGHTAQAIALVDEAAGSNPAPPEREVLSVRIPALIDQGRFADAADLIRSSHLEEPAKEHELVRVKLAQRASLPPAADRLKIEQELLGLVKSAGLRTSSDSRLARLALARSGIEGDLDPRNAPEAWDILAGSYEMVGDAAKAGRLELRAAARALELGQPQVAAGFRLRGGGFLFQSGNYAEADTVLSSVADDPQSGPCRARAGMLRALARGRALAAGTPGVTPSSYAEALRRQIHDFPTDPVTAEARWLLGSLLRATGQGDQAITLWNEIRPDMPRWLDARLAAIDLRRSALEARLLTAERKEIADAFRTAQELASESNGQARSESEVAELGLAEARLNLVPSAGKPQRALIILNRLLQLPLTPLQRYRAKLLRTIALVQVGPPYLEAEREAQTHLQWLVPSAHAPLLEAIRLVDQCASLAEADLHQRRLGLILRLLVQPVAQDSDEDHWTAEERAELKLRLARAYLFLGDERNARAALRGWSGPPQFAADDLYRDLADTYNRLEAYELAIDVARLRLKNLEAGSPSWFDAKYGLALAYFHAGRLKESAQLIDGTAILHPELGGGQLQRKFIHLRQRLGTRP